jgi:hypothetical protein
LEHSQKPNFTLIVNVAEDIRADGDGGLIWNCPISSGCRLSSKSEYTFISKIRTRRLLICIIMGTLFGWQSYFCKELYSLRIAAYVKDDENQDVLLAGLYGDKHTERRLFRRRLRLNSSAES